MSVSIGQWSAVTSVTGWTPGQEFTVNDHTPNAQYYSASAALNGGGFVTVWDSYGQDGSDRGVYGQRFDGNGQKVGLEFRANTHTAGNQSVPSVAALNDGGYVVTWHSLAQDGDSYGIFGQQYDANGDTVGSEFQANTFSAGSQNGTHVAGLAGGGFIVTWQSYGQIGAQYEVYGRRFNASAQAVSPEFQINSVTSGNQYNPTVIGMSDGSFVVTWQSSAGGGTIVRRFAANGTALTGEIVADTTTMSTNFPSVAELPGGGYVVVWSDYGMDGNGSAAGGRIFDSNNNPVGPPFQINTHTDSSQFAPRATALSDGSFVVTWQSSGQDGSVDGVYGQVLDATGTKIGDEFQINSHISGRQALPTVVALAGGDFAVTWDSDGGDGAGYGVAGKLFSAVQGGPRAEAPLDLSASLADTDGSETITGYTVSGLPADATLSAGTANGDGSWTLTPAQLAGLKISLPATYASSFDLTVTATTTEGANGATATGNETVQVQIGNIAPIAEDATATTDEDTAASGQLTASDYNAGDTLTYSVAQGPTHGSVSVNADGTYSYTPNGNWSGQDSFTFTVSDGNGGSDSGTVTVDVTPVADAPSVSVSIGQWQVVTNSSDWTEGQEFIVNTNRASHQRVSDAAVLDDGGFVTVWRSGGSSNHGQRFDSTGQPVGSEFLLTSYDSENGISNRHLSVACVAGGGLVAVWQAYKSDHSQYGVEGRRFDASGAPQGDVFQVAPPLDFGRAYAPSAANPLVGRLADGGFVVVYQRYEQVGSDYQKYLSVRRYDANGQAVGSRFDIDEGTGSTGSYSAVTGLSDGGFAIAWRADYRSELLTRRFDSSGNPITGELLVDSTSSSLYRNGITELSDGRYLITWSSSGIDGGGDAAAGRIYDAAGNAMGASFQINTEPSSHQLNPNVAALPSGGFVVTWQSNDQDGSDYGIFGQAFDSAGGKVGSEFQVNSFTAGSQNTPVTVSLSDGSFFVAWSSQGSDGDNYGVSAKFFQGPLAQTLAEAPLNLSANLADTDGSETITGYTVSGLPTGATLSAGTANGDGSWTLTPAQLTGLKMSLPVASAADFNLTVTATATEGANGATASGSQTVAVEVSNFDPVAADATVTVDEDASASGQLTASDVNAGDTLTFSVAQAPANGSVTANADGTYTYTPAGDWSGQDSFTYTVDDGNGGTDTGTVTVNVTPVADAPSVSVSVDNVALQTSVQLIGDPTLGNSFQLNSSTAGVQGSPDLAALPTGGFVAVWHAQNGYYGIYGQRFDASGNTVGDEFQIDTYAGSSQLYPKIAALSDGGFVATWHSQDQDGSSDGVYGQKFDASGNAEGGEFRVNTEIQSYQNHPRITALGDGGFVVVWRSYTQDGDAYGVYGQRYDAAGNAAGAEFRINTETANQQYEPSVTDLGGGGFVATWSSNTQDGSNLGIYGQRFDATGGKAGSEFLVNTYTGANQATSVAEGLSDGGFVVVYQSRGGDGNPFGIYGRRYDANGNPTSAEFKLNAVDVPIQVTGTSAQLSVQALDNGAFMAMWPTKESDNTFSRIGRLFGADNSPQGDEFVVASGMAAVSDTASLAVLSSGQVVAAWEGPDQSSDGVHGRFVTVTATSSDTGNITASVNVTTALTDTDGSESLSVTVSGLPPSATLSAGTNNGDGTWTLTPAQLSGLTLSIGVDDVQDFTLTVTATATEGGNGDAATATASTNATFRRRRRAAEGGGRITDRCRGRNRNRAIDGDRLQRRQLDLFGQPGPGQRLRHRQCRWYLQLYADQRLEWPGQLHLHRRRRKRRHRHRHHHRQRNAGRRRADRQRVAGNLDSAGRHTTNRLRRDPGHIRNPRRHGWFRDPGLLHPLRPACRCRAVGRHRQWRRHLDLDCGTAFGVNHVDRRRCRAEFHPDCISDGDRRGQW